MISRRLFLCSSSVAAALHAHTAHADSDRWYHEAARQQREGLCWQGSANQRQLFEDQLRAWMATQSIAPSLLDVQDHGNHHQAVLRVFPGEAGTLDLRSRPRLWLGHDMLPKPIPGIGSNAPVPTPVVSLKEIVLAFTHPGRCTMLPPEHAVFSTFLTHVRQRQCTALWAQRIGWKWPNGDEARWNTKHWRDGTPRTRAGTYAAYWDALVQPQKYAIGCYTAAKIALGMGLLDHAHRLHPSVALQRRTHAALWLNQDPLVGIEPSGIWSFEPGFDSAAPALPGKTHAAQWVDHPRHMVPGDWLYIFNTDPSTYAKTGYEGSNAIYLGGGQFSDYYNDHGFSYTFEEKLDDVHQWRHGVFSRSRDGAKAQALDREQLAQLEKTPDKGGLLLPWRVGPRMDLAMP